MVQFVSDTCTDTSGTALASHTGEIGATWTAQSVGAGDPTPVISSANRIRPGSAGSIYGFYRTSGIPTTSEYNVECDITLFGSATSKIGPAGRVAVGTGTGYTAFVTTAGAWTLYKVVGGAFTLLGSYSQTMATSTPYHCNLELRNNSQNLYITGVNGGAAVMSASDSAITAAGKAGIWSEADSTNLTGLHLDNFAATDPPDVYTLTRSSSGLLAINGWNGDTLPGSAFSTSDWTASTNLTLGVSGDGQLTGTPASSAAYYCVKRTSIADRAKSFIFSQSSAFAAASATAGTQGPAVHITQTSTPTLAAGAFTVTRAAGELVRVLNLSSGTPAAVGTDSTVTAKTTLTGYQATTFVDGTALTWKDLTSGTTRTETVAGSSGGLGFLQNGYGLNLTRWIASTDRYVTISGIPTGGSVELRNQSSTTLVSASESGGTVTLDLFGLDCGTAMGLVAKDSGGSILGTYRDMSGGSSDHLIAGGDTFSLTTPAAGGQPFTLRTGGIPFASNRPLFGRGY